MRWAWIGLAIVSTIGYLWLNPLLVLVQLPDGEEGDRAESKKDDEAEIFEGEEVDEGDMLGSTETEDDDGTEV